MDSLLKEVSKVEKKTQFSACINNIDTLLEEIATAKKQVEDAPSSSCQDIADILTNTSNAVTTAEKQLADSEKTIYNSISKLGKALDKTFKSNEYGDDNTPFSFPNEQESNEHVKMAILMHLVHNGEFDVATIFVKENNINESLPSLKHFYALYKIIDSIDQNDLGPAIKWVEDNHEKMSQKRSDLPFYLHKLQFLKLLFEAHDRMKALQYATENLSGFGPRYLNEISRLMSSVLYANDKDLSKTPYFDVYCCFSPSYDYLKKYFKMEYCSLLDLSPESPLLLATMAGCMALPTVNRMRAVMKSRGAEWTSKDELPVEVDLPENLQFHTIFVCPVTKEQTTDANPPMMLTCGHIISRNALNQLGKNHLSHVFKCPYCPQNGTLYEAKTVAFS